MATTLRNYLTAAGYASLTGGQSSDASIQHLSRAEQAIDDYVGPTCKHVQSETRGLVSAVNSKEVIDTHPASQLHIIDGYFEHCVIEIIGGTGAGQVRLIQSSSFDNRSVTVFDDWDTSLDTTSFYRIYQLAKFPREQDVYSSTDGRRYYKAIPDAIKQAVAAQIEFIIQKGDAFFVGNDADFSSESVGNYSYSKANSGQSATVSALAPRARTLLRGYKNSGGVMLAENPTSL